MDQEKVIVIDFGGQYNSWLHAASASAMCTVRFILTVPTSNRSRQ